MRTTTGKWLLVILLTLPLLLEAQAFWPWAAKDSLTRAAAVTAYTAGDAVNDTAASGTGNVPRVLVFDTGLRKGAKGYIATVVGIADTGNSQAVTLHFFNDSTHIFRTADNAVISFNWADSAAVRNYVGSVNLTMAANVSTTGGYGTTANAGLQFQLPSASTKLYAIVEDKTTFTGKRLGRYVFIVSGYTQ